MPGRSLRFVKLFPMNRMRVGFMGVISRQWIGRGPLSWLRRNDHCHGDDDNLSFQPIGPNWRCNTDVPRGLGPCSINRSVSMKRIVWSLAAALCVSASLMGGIARADELKVGDKAPDFSLAG